MKQLTPARTALILTLAERGKSVLEATLAVDAMLEVESLSLDDLESQYAAVNQQYGFYEQELSNLGLMLLSLEARIERQKNAQA